jgi:hypothetical protein
MINIKGDKKSRTEDEKHYCFFVSKSFILFYLFVNVN